MDPDELTVDIGEAREAEPADAPLLPVKEVQPENLVVLPLAARPVYPSMVVPLGLPSPRYAETVKYAVEQRQGHICLLLLKGDDPPVDNPQLEDVYIIGVLGKVVILRSLMRLLIQNCCLKRC